MGSNNKRKTTDLYKKEVFDIVGAEYDVIGEYIMNKVKIKMKHNKCNQEFDVTPNNFLSKNSRCPFCVGTSTLVGISDINTTHPEIAKILFNKDDGYKYKAGSNVKLDWVCPQCGEIIKNRPPYRVINEGLACKNCSEGISYPNKFSLALFKQLFDILDYYEREYSPEWADRYSYDNYFVYKGIEYIVEMDGGIGHGNSSDISGTRPARFLLNNDIIKDKLALEHNIQMIRIPSLMSNKEYLKNEILNSELNNILNLENINWDKCELESLTSLKIKACELWNNGIYSTELISQELHISQNTVECYLNQCHKIGLCNYDKSIVYGIAKNKRKYTKHNKYGKPFICNENGYVFSSIIVLEENSENIFNTKLHKGNISMVLLKKQSNTKGFTFQYITREEFNQIKSNPLTSHLAYGDFFNIQNSDT